ncbi:MAG: hydroxypyruvate isomerase [Betaproteobacteria bacterium]|nr:hydroxypyruvate isomerase [Betaproteobacteria bacterium]NDH43797.1 hydroxypyruvate isomerase [Betaproteobacteria bacterium]
MPQFAANLSMLYPELPFLDRFGAAADDGFKAVEYLFPYDFSPEEIQAELKAHDLKNVLFNLPPGDWQAGERGLAALPGRQAAFRDALELAIVYAKHLGTKQVHLMAGLQAARGSAQQQAMQRSAMRDCYVNNLRDAAKRLAEEGLLGLIEPINPRDIPGYFLNRQDDAIDILDEVGSEALALQLDLYHCQIVHGDLAKHLERLISRVGHIQIASVPQRHEPDTGEIHYPFLFDLIDRLDYKGWIGCEYRPADPSPGGTSRGLAWMRHLG